MKNSVDIEDDETDLIWDKLCVAVNRNDATIVAKVLQCRKLHSLSVHDPLLCSSALADQLLLQVENELSIFSIDMNCALSIELDGVHDISELQPRKCDAPTSGIKVKALLISPSLYETPWKMCCSFVQFMHENGSIQISAGQGTYPDSSSLAETAVSSIHRSGITDIQCFLRQVVTAWWDEEKKQTSAAISTASPSPGRRRSIRPINDEVLSERNPRYWMLKLVEIAVDPLFCGGKEENDALTPESIQQTSHEDWIMSQELISTIVSLSNDVEQSVLHAVLDLLFPIDDKRKVRSNSLLRWIGLATEIRSFLREKDWKRLYSSTQDVLQKYPHPIPSEHWPNLVEKFFMVSVMKTTDSIFDWQNLMFTSLVIATRNLETGISFGQIEAKLQSCLSSLSLYVLQDWATQLLALTADSLYLNASISSSNFKYVQTNVVLLVWSSSQRSASQQMVSRLVARAFDETKSSALSYTKENYLNTKCWEHVMEMTLGPRRKRKFSKSLTCFRSRGDTDLRRQGIAKALRDLFDDVRYAGQGTFRRLSTDEADLTATTLTEASSFLLRSLFICSHESPASVSMEHAAKRAQLWLQFVNESVLQSQSNDSLLDFIVAIAVLVTVYSEVPKTRTVLVRNMLQTLKAKFAANIYLSCVVYTTVMRVVIASSSEDTGTDSYDKISAFDVMSELFAQPFPFELYCDLARALVLLPAGRRALLSAAEKRFVRRSSQAAKTSRHMNQRMTEEILCCLFALLQMIQKPIWDDIAVTSWLILSNIIIENSGNLPSRIRTWLFQELKGLVLKGKFIQDVDNHLLRVCFVRLLFVLGSTDFRHRTCTEDIFCIFDLIFTIIYNELLHINIEEKDIKYRVLNRCVFNLSNLIGAKCLEYKSIMKDVGICDDAARTLTNDLDESSISTVFAFYCLSLALRSNGSENIFFDEVNLPSIDEFIQFLIDGERKELNMSHLSDSSSPWFIARSHIDFTDNIYPEGKQFKLLTPQIRLPLYDIVISLLMGPKWWINARCERSIPSRQSLYLCGQLVSAFIVKRRLSDSLDDIKDRFANIETSSGPMFRSFLGFCTFILPIMRQKITTKSHFVLTNEMLAATLDLCDPLSLRFGPYDGSFSSGPRLECFYDLYKAIAEEKSSVDLIRYLECCCSGGGVTIRSISLKVPDDIYCFVRRLRTSIFRCISLGIAECIHQYESDGQTLILRNEIDMDEEFSLDSLIRFIRSLSVDIYVGLSEGLSGGLTHDLYVAIIDSMEQLTQLVLKSLKSDGAFEFSLLSSLISACIAVSKGLEFVLCNFSLHQAAALKKTLFLCAGALPSAIRWTRRHSSFSDNYQDATNPVACELFEQLSNILKSKAEFVCVMRTSWDIVAGSEHIGGIRYLSDSDDEVSELSDGFTDVVKSQRLLPEVVDQADKMNVKLLLRTERSWVWSLCCLLEVFEDDWAESFSLIQHTTAESIFSGNLSKRYVEIRQRELALTMKAIGQVFQETKSQKSPTQGLGAVASVYVVHLPSPAKLKLCGAVDRIVVTLQKSIKVVLLHLQADYADYETLVSIASNPSFLEAFSCFYGWLSVCVKNTDLYSGIQKWYMAEKAAGTSPDENHVEDVSVLSRLPKLYFRLEELFTSLQQLSQILKPQATRFKRAEISPFLTTIDNLIQSYEIDCYVSFRGLISKKLAFLKEEQLQVQRDFGMLTSDDMINKKNRKRTIDIAKRMKRERRRKLIRSRNFVVDTWLQADRVTGEDEVVDDDPYADLEDFLVDG
jgi:hypothetical protein